MCESDEEAWQQLYYGNNYKIEREEFEAEKKKIEEREAMMLERDKFEHEKAQLAVRKR